MVSPHMQGSNSLVISCSFQGKVSFRHMSVSFTELHHTSMHLAEMVHMLQSSR